MANAETRDKAITQAQQSLAIYLRQMGYPAPHYIQLADVPKTVMANLLAPPNKPEGIRLTPAPMNPISLEIERIIERSDHSLRSLAQAIGTSPAALARLKDPFYWGHSIRSLRDVAQACNQQLEVKFKAVPRVVQGSQVATD